MMVYHLNLYEHFSKLSIYQSKSFQLCNEFVESTSQLMYSGVELTQNSVDIHSEMGPGEKNTTYI